MTHTRRKLSKAEAGRLGGLATVKAHGSLYLSAIGSKGGRATHDKYSLVPSGPNDFAMTDRLTGRVVAYISGASIHERQRYK